ncbi:MAG: nicotinamide mononucleotide transporter [Methanobrevibacter sp.]|nr:nicotinamide mononucleotide transporter [Methanobrevibacter sp.]MBO7692146.1 nicotinamide mononucleotide transporter [Methanobrevibacter sp.]
MVLLVSILGSVFSLGGNILIMLKKKSGWITWIIGNLLWIIYNFLSEFNLPMVLMYLAYMIINIAGFIKWKRNE